MQNFFMSEIQIETECGLAMLPRDQGLSEVQQEIIQDNVGVDCRVVRVGEEVGHHCLSNLNQSHLLLLCHYLLIFGSNTNLS